MSQAIERIVMIVVAFGLFLLVGHLALSAIDKQICEASSVTRAQELGCFEDGILK